MPSNRDKKIIKLCKKGRQIDVAREFKISQQRVQQILKKHDDTYIPKKKKPCSICQKTDKKIRSQVYNVCDRCYVKWKKAKDIERFKNRYRTCDNCGEIRKIHSFNLCTACYYRQKYHNDPEYRERHKVCVENWSKNNPEKVKEISKRASRKYQEKIKKLKVK